MRKRLIGFSIALLMAGCAVNPVEIQERGERQDFTSALAPRAAIDCMARNADNVKPTVAARIRDGSHAGVVELVAQGASGGGTLAFFQARPVATGSAITAWISPMLVFHEREIGRKIVEGC